MKSVISPASALSYSNVVEGKEELHAILQLGFLAKGHAPDAVKNFLVLFSLDDVMNEDTFYSAWLTQIFNHIYLSQSLRLKKCSRERLEAAAVSSRRISG